jgi:hypothetical protein
MGGDVLHHPLPSRNQPLGKLRITRSAGRRSQLLTPTGELLGRHHLARSGIGTTSVKHLEKVVQVRGGRFDVTLRCETFHRAFTPSSDFRIPLLSSR